MKNFEEVRAFLRSICEKDYFEGDLDKFQKIFIDLQISKNYRMIKKNLQIFFLKMSRILLLLFKNFKNSLINHEKKKKKITSQTCTQFESSNMGKVAFFARDPWKDRGRTELLCTQ